MSFKKYPDLHRFLTQTIAETDADGDSAAVERFIAKSNHDQRQLVINQATGLIESGDVTLEEIGTETNRWFADEGEASDWLSGLAKLIAASLEATDGTPAGSEVVVKDSNGAILNEGDSAQVIKDLKVKGGSSDLKRGTQVKNIHLIGDAEAIECRVAGSTLVLKTCFLKKI